jgi:hypothetical protein
VLKFCVGAVPFQLDTISSFKTKYSASPRKRSLLPKYHPLVPRQSQDPASQKAQECETQEMADANPSKSRLEEDRTLSWPVVIACVFGALTFNQRDG